MIVLDIKLWPFFRQGYFRTFGFTQHQIRGYAASAQSKLNLSMSTTFADSTLLRICPTPPMQHRRWNSSTSSLIGWGANDGLGLGVGRKSTEYPLALPYFVPLEAVPIQLAVGANHSAVIASEAEGPALFMTGLNTQFQLASSVEKYTTSFAKISLPNNQTPLSVDCGRCHTVVVVEDGLFVAGANTLGQCGAGPDAAVLSQWHRVQVKDGIPVDVACGLDHTLVLLKDGGVLSCGWSADGQTGLGNLVAEHNAYSLTRIPNLNNIIKVVSSADTSLFLHEEGAVYACGNSEYGQTGLGNQQDRVVSPTIVDTLPEEIIDVASGGPASLFLGRSGTVYGVGLSVFGEKLALAPEPVQLPGRGLAVFAGGRHFFVVLKDGLYSWGTGALGSHGHVSSQNQPIPVVHSPKRLIYGTVRHVACGSEATLVVASSSPSSSSSSSSSSSMPST